MEWIKVFSLELGLCYTEQNLELNNEEMEECFNEDQTILEGVLMSLLSEQPKLDPFYTKEIYVYGSLRKGEYNNYLLKDSEYIGKGIVKGFKMYSLGSYPFVHQTNNKDDIIVVEGYKVDIETYNSINKMERLAGYTKVNVIISTDMEIIGEIYKIDNPIRYYDKVVSGDWVAERETRYINQTGIL